MIRSAWLEVIKMAVTVKEGRPVLKALCAEQKETVGRAIYANMALDDRDPHEVVATDFGGDWDHYYRSMALWHGIDLSKS